jgi:hypothetical protein
VAISLEQRKKLGLPQQEGSEHEHERTPDLQGVEEGEEISPDVAERLQPQMGNQAVQALLARTSSSTQTDSGTAVLELAENVGVSEEEEFEGGSLQMPTIEMGGGGDIPVEVAPWEVGRLFGGDDDEPTKPKPPKRRRRSPTGSGTPGDESPLFEDEDALPTEHADHIETTLGETPKMRDEFRSGDARYRAIETGLQKPHAIGRRMLQPEAMVDRTDHLDPIGRPTSIARFMVGAGTKEQTRALARTLAIPVSVWLPTATGHAGAAARLASLTVCTEAIEGGGIPTDNAIRLALCLDAWPSAVNAARDLAEGGRVVAPKIVEGAGETLDSDSALVPRTLTTTDALTGIRLGRLALEAILPDTHTPTIPNIAFGAPPALPTQDPAIAAVDAVLAEFTGGQSPSDLPEERRLSPERIQPVLDAATKLVNRLGQAQVEFAAAAIALARVRPGSPARATLVHADRALRLLARTIVQNGDTIHRARGAPVAAIGTIHIDAIQAMRDTAVAFDALRGWCLNSIAEALYR